MKLLLSIIFLVNINVFSYQFSEILPENTIFYLSLEDFKSFDKNLNNLPKDTFYKSKYFKNLKNKMKKISSVLIYGDEKEIQKTDLFLKDLEHITNNSFAFTVALDRFFKPQFSLFIDSKSLKEPFEKIYKHILEEEIKAGDVQLKKNIFKGVKIDVLELKSKKAKVAKNNKSKPGADLQIVYATFDDKFIVTSSIDYMELLISTIKNKKAPKLSDNLIFKKDKVKYKDSDFYMFLNLKSLMKLSAFDKDMNEALDKLSLKTLDSLILYSKFDEKTKWYNGFIKLTSRSLPSVIKAFLSQREEITIPKFIPDNCYSFNAFHLDFSAIPSMLDKFSDKRDAKRMRDLEASIGITIKEIFDSIESDFYYLNFFDNKKETFAFIFSFAKPSFLINMLRVFGSNPTIGLSEKEYLDGNIFTATGNFTLLGYGLAYKNNYFIIGNIDTIKEIMQKMGGKSGSFHNTALYKKLLSFNNKKQNILSLTNTAISVYTLIKGLKKDFNKTYGDASTKKEMKVIKIVKEIVDSLNEISLEKMSKYFGNSLFRVYTKENELVLEFSEVK